MADRYFTQTAISADQVVLDGHEAHHLIHVIRAKPGMEVTLFDGSGAEFVATVDRVKRSEVELTVVSRAEIDRELSFDLTLAVALPKGDRQKWLVEKTVELGVTRIVPLITTRGVAQPVRQAVDRLRRTVIEASKQCGRNRLAEISEPQKWSNFVGETTDVKCRLLAHPRSTKKKRKKKRGHSTFQKKSRMSPFLYTLSDKTPHEPVIVGVGPEGGFTTEEVAIAIDAAWHPIDLGPRILRIETAAVFVVGLVTGRSLLA